LCALLAVAKRQQYDRGLLSAASHLLITGCPRIREIRENREKLQLFFPAGKNQGIWFWGAKIREKSGNLILGSQNQGILFL